MFHGGPILPRMYSSCICLHAYAVQCAIESSKLIPIRVDCAWVGAYFSCGSDGSKIVQKFNLTHTVQDVRLFMESYAKPRWPLWPLICCVTVNSRCLKGRVLSCTPLTQQQYWLTTASPSRSVCCPCAKTKCPIRWCRCWFNVWSRFMWCVCTPDRMICAQDGGLKGQAMQQKLCWIDLLTMHICSLGVCNSGRNMKSERWLALTQFLTNFLYNYQFSKYHINNQLTCLHYYISWLQEYIHIT